MFLFKYVLSYNHKSGAGARGWLKKIGQFRLLVAAKSVIVGQPLFIEQVFFGILVLFFNIEVLLKTFFVRIRTFVHNVKDLFCPL